MPVAAILQLVQILSGLGGAAVDITKIVEAIRKDGRTGANDAEVAQIQSLVKPHKDALNGVDEDSPTAFLWK